jgi:branched-subunit amino acid ABC-type transport system permease component
VLAQNIVHGILLGSFYATIALELSLVFGVMRLVNLAHGVLIVGGGYLAYALCSVVPMDPLLSVVFVCPATFLFGYALQRFLLTNLLLSSATSLRSAKNSSAASIKARKWKSRSGMIRKAKA